MSYMNKINSGHGRDWIQLNLSSTKFVKSEDTIQLAGKLNALAFVWPYYTIKFGSSTVGKDAIIHELGHVLDNNLKVGLVPATVNGGGPADSMVRAMGGHPGNNPLRMQYGDLQISPSLSINIVSDYDSYSKSVAGKDPWLNDYANNGVSDDFAQTFKYTINGIKSPLGFRTNWMATFLQGLSY